MSYVDGFVIPIKKSKVKEYLKMAQEGAVAWKKHGALEYFECVGEDLNPKVPKEMKEMKGITFPQIAGAKSGETVLFSFIVFKSRKHRDTVNKKVMKEMGEKYKDLKDFTMPFDMKRMAYGGFKALVKK